jgi:hypothetical protein
MALNLGQIAWGQDRAQTNRDSTGNRRNAGARDRQGRNQGRPQRTKNRREPRARDQASTTTQASAPTVAEVIPATGLMGAGIVLSDGERFGFIDDFVVDNAGRVLFVITNVEGGNVALPFHALSFAEISSGVVTLDVPISVMNGVPRLGNIPQLSDPVFQERLMTFLRDQAGLSGITRIRLAPGEIRPATALLGTDIQTQDQNQNGPANKNGPATKSTGSGGGSAPAGNAPSSSQP